MTVEIIDENSSIWQTYPFNKILRNVGDKTLAVHAVRLSYIILESTRYGYVNVNEKIKNYIVYAKKYYNINMDYDALFNATLKALEYLNSFPVYTVGKTIFIVPRKYMSVFLREHPLARMKV